MRKAITAAVLASGLSGCAAMHATYVSAPGTEATSEGARPVNGSKNAIALQRYNWPGASVDVAVKKADGTSETRKVVYDQPDGERMAGLVSLGVVSSSVGFVTFIFPGDALTRNLGLVAGIGCLAGGVTSALTSFYPADDSLVEAPPKAP